MAEPFGWTIRHCRARWEASRDGARQALAPGFVPASACIRRPSRPVAVASTAWTAGSSDRVRATRSRAPVMPGTRRASSRLSASRRSCSAARRTSRSRARSPREKRGPSSRRLRGPRRPRPSWCRRGLVVVVVVAPPTAATISSRATALRPGGPALGEVGAEVGADGLADLVEVDADRLERLAVLGVVGSLGRVGRLGGLLALGFGIDMVLRDQLARGVEVDAVVPERGVGHAPGVGEQAEEEVAGADLAMAELAGDVRRLGDGDPGFGVESGVHGGAPGEFGAPTADRCQSRECFW